MTSDRRWQIDTPAAGLRLDRFLAADDRLGSRGQVVRALERGKVLVNGVEAGAHENQFIPFATDVQKLLRPGVNELLVRLAPVAASVADRSTSA